MTQIPGGSFLQLDAEEMRRTGYAVVDALVQRWTGLGEDRAWQRGSRAELERSLYAAPPESPTGFDATLQQMLTAVLPFAARVDHPRFLAFVGGCGTWPGVLGDLLATGHNVFQGTWLASSGPSEIELIVLDWFRQWLGYSDGAAGILVSGGSVANLTALACARASVLGEHDPDAVIYTSDQAHSSVVRAARVLGFRAERIRSVATDAHQRLDVRALESAIAGDRAAGLRPFCVIANAGTTSTGAIDPLHEVAHVARDAGLWMHTDAAYGGFAILTQRGRVLLRGIDESDSVTLDPHKWLYQPFEVGCVLVRNGTQLRDTFHIMPDYLQDTAVGGGEVNFADRGIQLTRGARALKIWLSLHTFGLSAFRAAIAQCMELAERAEDYVRASDRLELVTPAALGIVCFRRRAADAETVNVRALDHLMHSGVGMISSTRVNGEYSLRICVLSHYTTWDDVEAVLRAIETAPVEES